jgi:PPM family protein phosphatase
MSAVALRCAVRTDVGRRSNNEDSVFASSRVAVVADGVGGHTAGEVASRLVVDAFVSLDKAWLAAPLEAALAETVQDGNDRIAFVIGARPQHDGMGTTVTAVLAGDDGRVFIANVGDSRTYLYRDSALRQLTRDDSLVQELLERGTITTEEARGHPARSVVTAALNGRPVELPAPITLEALPGDRLLLCSDGLSDVVEDTTIASLLQIGDRDASADALVDAALAAGGRDNITVVVADIEPRDDADSRWVQDGCSAAS